jgi:hypothetical protein
VDVLKTGRTLWEFGCCVGYLPKDTTLHDDLLQYIALRISISKDYINAYRAIGAMHGFSVDAAKRLCELLRLDWLTHVFMTYDPFDDLEDWFFLVHWICRANPDVGKRLCELLDPGWLRERLSSIARLDGSPLTAASWISMIYDTDSYFAKKLCELLDPKSLGRVLSSVNPFGWPTADLIRPIYETDEDLAKNLCQFLDHEGIADTLSRFPGWAHGYIQLFHRVNSDAAKKICQLLNLEELTNALERMPGASEQAEDSDRTYHLSTCYKLFACLQKCEPETGEKLLGQLRCEKLKQKIRDYLRSLKSSEA